jgi:hypothetical protein
MVTGKFTTLSKIGIIMKKLILATALSLSVSFSSTAENFNEKLVIYVGNNDYLLLCQAVVENDSNLFEMSLNDLVGDLESSKERVLRRVLADNRVSCSDKGLAEFISARKATDIVNFLNKKV